MNFKRLYFAAVLLSLAPLSANAMPITFDLRDAAIDADAKSDP